MIEKQTETRNEALREVALHMMTAARTAPKACGVDNLEIAVLTGEDITRLAATLRELCVQSGRAFFGRDADNLDQSGAVVLIGTRNVVLNLNCALCGFPTCGEKQEMAPDAPCAFNMNDLGIAIGSAVSVAADCRVDCRVMYSAGVAAKYLDFLPGCHAIMAIPLSASGKNPFFDRKPL